MFQGSTTPANTNDSALDTTGSDPCPETQLAQLDCAISELLAVRGELDLDRRNTQSAIRHFTLALLFNDQNERAMLGKTLVEARLSNDDGNPESVFNPTSNGSSPPPLFRVESGYRVVAIRPEHDLEEEPRVISEFGITPGQKRLAMLYAKELAREPDERRQMEMQDEVTDQYFSTAVQRFHSLIETVALIAPQDQLDSPRIPYLPAPDSRDQVSALSEPRGIWRCLVETDDEKYDSSRTKAEELDSFIHCIESTVCTAVSEADLVELVKQFEDVPSFPDAFERLFVACQSHARPALQDDLARALLEDDDEGLPVRRACHLSAALQAVQDSICAATIEKASATLSRYPAHFRSVFELDLHAFIYETLLFAVSRHPSLRQETVRCA